MFGGIIEAIGKPFKEAIDYFRGKVNLPTKRWQENYGAANAKAFSVAGAMADDLLRDFRREVVRALEDGVSIQEFRAQFDALVAKHGWSHTGEPGYRAELIYRTNLSTAYAAGRYAQMTEPETLAAFPFWEYVHSGNPNFREEHKDWDGLVLSADDPFWDTHYPPNGWNCGCRVRVLSERGLARAGKSGPDRAPSLEMRPWTDPETGRTRQVPAGIDPGFEYNVGKAWREADGR